MSEERFSDSPFFCGQLYQPGLAVDFDLYVNYSNRETTDDQVRIEAVLAKLASPNSRILHIGIGNSQLAETFCNKGHVVDGITVSEKEKQHGNTLNLSNYRVYRANKYHRDFAGCFEKNQFDYIVDNNLASFSCCQYHFYQMLENYLGCLKVKGLILTDQRGMDWALAAPGFILGFDELKSALGALPLKVTRVTDMVYALELLADQDTDKPKTLSVYAKRCGDDGQNYIETFIPQAKP